MTTLALTSTQFHFLMGMAVGAAMVLALALLIWVVVKL